MRFYISCTDLGLSKNVKKNKQHIIFIIIAET